MLRGSTDASNGAKTDMSDATACKSVSVAPCCTLVCYSKGFMPRVTRGGFVLPGPPESDQTGQTCYKDTGHQRHAAFKPPPQRICVVPTIASVTLLCPLCEFATSVLIRKAIFARNHLERLFLTRDHFWRKTSFHERPTFWWGGRTLRTGDRLGGRSLRGRDHCERGVA